MLDLCSFGQSSALFEVGDDFWDGQALKCSLVLLEKIFNPNFGQVRKSFTLSRLYVSIVVENSKLAKAWDLLVLEDELLHILASLEEFINRINLECALGTAVPFLAFNI